MILYYSIFINQKSKGEPLVSYKKIMINSTKESNVAVAQIN